MTTEQKLRYNLAVAAAAYARTQQIIAEIERSLKQAKSHRARNLAEFQDARDALADYDSGIPW